MKKKIVMMLLLGSAFVSLDVSVLTNADQLTNGYTYDKPIDPDAYIHPIFVYDKHIDPDSIIEPTVVAYDKQIDPDAYIDPVYAYDKSIDPDSIEVTVVDPPIGPLSSKPLV